MTIRKRTSVMTLGEKNRYKNVIQQLLNATGNPYGKLVSHHANMMHNMHGSMGPVGRQRFLAWHRVYLLKFEQMGQAIDADFFIPYWKWTTNRSVPSWLKSFTPKVTVPTQGVIQVSRTPAPAAGLPTTAQTNSIVNNPGLNFTQFTSQIEGIHNTVHGWVGGTMNNIMISPADPLFWLHHAQIDRLWSVWQAKPANAGKNPTLSGADRVMDPWTETEQQVRSIANLNYSYGP